MNSESMSASSSFQSLNMDLNCEFVNLDPKYKCVKCKTWLKNPMQIPCGHRVCRSCVQELFASNSGSDRVIRCPSGEEGCEDIEQDKVWINYYVYKYGVYSVKISWWIQCTGCGPLSCSSALSSAVIYSWCMEMTLYLPLCIVQRQTFDRHSLELFCCLYCSANNLWANNVGNKYSSHYVQRSNCVLNTVCL